MHGVGGLCQQFAHILGGRPHVEHDVCSVERGRPHIQVTIFGRSSHNTLNSEWSFESLDQQGNALNLGETTLLEDEIYPFMWHLQRNGIMITALHNHWLMETPRLFYLHYASVEEPLSFARKVAEAYRVLR